MSADIAATPPVPAAPVEGGPKRADTAQGDDRRVAKGRVTGSLGSAGEHPEDTGRLHIEEDEATGEFVYRIVDEKTGKTIRQWPREELLRMNEIMGALQGAILDRRI